MKTCEVLTVKCVRQSDYFAGMQDRLSSVGSSSSLGNLKPKSPTEGGIPLASSSSSCSLHAAAAYSPHNSSIYTSIASSSTTPPNTNPLYSTHLQVHGQQKQAGASEASTSFSAQPSGLGYSRTLELFRQRIADEGQVLLSLLEAYEGIMNYDLLASTEALYTAHARLLRLASYR